MRWWGYMDGAEVDFSWVGKTTDNTVTEAFNVRFRA